jgi:predicted GIY-YIG superfamily endonuclease
MAASADHYVYSLVSCASPGKGYIGYTNQAPERRLAQHNGELAGGARPTLLHRPWMLQAVVGPFPTKAAALQFEHGWAYPRVHSPWIQRVRTAKGFWPARSAYAKLLSRTKSLQRNSASSFNLSVLDIMLNDIEYWAALGLVAAFP